MKFDEFGPSVTGSVAASYRGRVLRYMASPRWIFWHVFCLVIVLAMIGLGIWQWQVALTPDIPGGPTPWHPRNLVYWLQWWIFAGFAGWFWYRFLRDQRDADAADDAADEADRIAELEEAEAAQQAPESIELPAEPMPDAQAGTER